MRQDSTHEPATLTDTGSDGPKTAREVFQQWSRWTDARLDLGARTKEGYRRIAASLAAWAADQPLAGLDLTPYVRTRQGDGLSPRTIALELRVAKIAFRWAQEEDYVPRRARLRIPRVRVDPCRFVINHNTPTPAEAHRAVAAMPDDDWRLAVVLLARTGARVGEVVHLRIRDYESRRGVLVLGAVDAASKTGLRRFPLDSDTQALLAPRQGLPEAPLLDFEGRRDPKQAIRRRLLRACDAAHVVPFTPHGLRRMVVGRLLRADVDAGTAAALTGHSVDVMLRYYQVVSDRDRRLAVEQACLGDLLAAAEGLEAA